MTSAPLTIGSAGLGRAGQAFIPALLKHPGWLLAAFAEPDRSTREALAAAYGVAGYATLEAMLVHPGLDAVCLATPTGLHAEGAITALSAGKRDPRRIRAHELARLRIEFA